jgi:hypothetical protein
MPETEDIATGRVYLASRGEAEEQKLLESSVKEEKETANIVRQVFDPRFQSRAEPVEIMLLTGKYKGRILDLGFNALTLSEEQGAGWSDAENTNIRVSSNFRNIRTRTFTFTCEFSALNENVRQISEALSHTHEITDESFTPPLLRLFLGDTVIYPCACTDLKWNYDEEISGQIGWRHCSVDLSIKLISSQGSPHQLAPPILSQKTYLEAAVDALSESERQRQGELAVARGVLDPCLGEEGNQQIQELIEQQRLADPSAIAQLDDEAFLQAAGAGLISKEMLQNPIISEKLFNALAKRLAERAIGNRFDLIDDVVQAIKTKDSSGLPPFLTSTPVGQSISSFDRLVTQHGKIYESILNQRLNPADSIFQPTTSVSLEDALINGSSGDEAAIAILDILSCGLSLRRLGAERLVQDPASQVESEATALEGINRAIASGDKDLLRRVFQLDLDQATGIIERLLANGPFKSKSDFVKQTSPDESQVNGYVLWSNFYQEEYKTLQAINQVLINPQTTVEGVMSEFKMSKAQAEKLLGDRKPFDSKQSFLERLNSDPSKPAIQDPVANQAWQYFQQNHGSSSE